MKTDTYTPMHGGRARLPTLTCVGVVVLGVVLGEVVWLLAQGRCPGCVWRDDRVLLPDPRMQQSLGQVSITVGEVERVRRAAGQCALLVCGAGFDSAFWNHASREPDAFAAAPAQFTKFSWTRNVHLMMSGI